MERARDYSEWLLEGPGAVWGGRLALLLVLVALAGLLAPWVWRLALPSVTPSGPAEMMATSEAVNAIVERHWFGVADASSSPAAKIAAVALADIRLRGLIAPSRKNAGGMAIFSVQGGPDRMVVVGGEIAAGVTLIRVQASAVTVRRAGVDMQLELPQRGRS